MPSAFDTKSLIVALEEMATLMELARANTFKVRAHENAARAIEAGEFDVAAEVEAGTLRDQKGFGEAMVKKVTQFVKEGKIDELDELRAEIPEGLVAMTKIPGLGPKKIHQIWKELEITTVDSLEMACKKERLRALKGFSEKTEKKILDGITFIRAHSGQTHWDRAWNIAQEILLSLKKVKATQRIELAGSLRRRREVVKDIDIVASSKTPKAVMDAFVKLSNVEEVIAKGDTKTSVRLALGIQCDLRVVSDEQFPFALAHFTGSKEHNVAMRGRAQREFNIRVSEYGLFDESKGDKLIPCKDEQSLYERLGLQFIPPEMREGMGEIEVAEKHEVPDLITEKDLQGTLHMHTTYSDGIESVESMATACKELGFKWLGIADHSVTAFYAGGMKPDEVKRQFDEIDEVNAKLNGIHIFKGIEVDILPDGSVDYDEKIWKLTDYLIASVHSSFGLSEKEMTNRICRALENPWVTILGHPTGRLLLSRDAYAVNMEAVIDKAGETRRMIEINANPRRLDIDWRWHRRAKERGIMMPICPDAHTIPMLHDTWTGVGIARKGWLTAKDVLNTRSVDEVKKIFKKSRS